MPGTPAVVNNDGTPPIQVGLPNGECLQSSKKCILNIPNLPVEVRVAHVFPVLTTNSLLSIVTLCDSGCEATFNKHELVITLNNNEVMRGVRDPVTKLWRVPLTQDATINMLQPGNHKLNTLTQAKNIKYMIHFYHAAAFSPEISTFADAARHGYFHIWPQLTVENIRKYLQTMVATAKGHMDQTRCNQKSSQDTDTLENNEDEGNIQPTNLVFTTVNQIGKIYADLT